MRLENYKLYIDRSVKILLEKMKVRLQEVKQTFQELIQIGQEWREKEILEYYDTELPKTIEKEKKVRQ